MATHIFLGSWAAQLCQRCHNLGSTPLGTRTTCFRLWEPLCGPAMVSTPHTPRQHLQYPFLSTAQLSKWDWISSHFPSPMSGQRSDTGERPTSTGRTKTKAKAWTKERVTGALFKFLQLTRDWILYGKQQTARASTNWNKGSLNWLHCAHNRPKDLPRYIAGLWVHKLTWAGRWRNHWVFPLTIILYIFLVPYFFSLLFSYCPNTVLYYSFNSYFYNLLFCVCVQLLSHVQLFATPWTLACQATPSMGSLGATVRSQAEPQRQETQLQDFGPLENFRPYWTLTDVNMPKGLHLNTETKLHPRASKLQCRTCMRACMLSCFSCVWLFVTPWTIVRQAPL